MKGTSVAAVIGGFLAAVPLLAAPAYHLTKTVSLGAPDRWDYVVFDAGSKRVFVAHGDLLTVVDANAGAVIGSVGGIAGGTHGAAISAPTGQGYTDDGKAGQVVAFDLQTLKATHHIPADADADGMVLESPPATSSWSMVIRRRSAS